MIATDSLTPLSSAELSEADELSHSDRPDAALYQELDKEAYETLAAEITRSEQALALCRELALTQGKVLVFQRDLLMQQIQTDAG